MGDDVPDVRWVNAGAAGAVPPGKAILHKHGRLEILIFHLPDEILGREGVGECWTAFENTCPHAGAPLFAEHFDGECVTCMYHGLRFRAVDGECPDAAGWGLDRFPVKEEGGQIMLGVPARG